MSNIFKSLKEDHDRHRKMLEQLGDTSGDSEERHATFKAFKEEVSAHAAAEEQSLYSTMLECPELTEKGRHSVAEHKEIDDFIEELEDTDMSSPGWAATFKKMRHRYEHHIDEEETEIFPAAQKVLSGKVTKEISGEFNERKTAELEEQ
ncbi:hemerythrin HHE cation-binding protein [Croceicoccus estronivorus]|uniref:hemerythrin domain-containing protein n=1 Tax=Croceicoccus estronivorus TaxID=1172626 RepID=UPI0008330B24|nr:hemerythrin domain-containing protein [Croceicoccus estronivorus]OCC22663.1 hemerythrin HHE cation-binding protein [Croceicoccus estronivorus]